MKTALQNITINDIVINMIGQTNIKYAYKNGTDLLKIINKSEEDRIVSGMRKEYVSMEETKVVFCEQNDPVFLYTDGLGPCVAALAYCQLKDGNRILGCAHMPVSDKVKLLARLVEAVKKDLHYQGEKIQCYFAGGACDDQEKGNSKFYDLICSFVVNNREQNLELRGILFDPFQKTDSIMSRLHYPHSPEELCVARDTDPVRYQQMNQEHDESNHVRSLLSCRAGITSEGVPVVRKFVDISFEHNPDKYPDYKAIQNYCSSVLKLDLSQMKKGNL